MTKRILKPRQMPQLRVEVVDAGRSAHRGWQSCTIGSDIKFSTERLESYFFASWQPDVFDLLLLAAAVEFCDYGCARPKRGWGRQIELKLPVHDLAKWQQPEVSRRLHEALEFLTGDSWNVTFYPRKEGISAPRQSQFPLPVDVKAVIPYSDGLDSRAVAGLMSESLGTSLVRVRLGKLADASLDGRRQPFASIPYKVKPSSGSKESSGRSRGFKFTLIGAIGAQLAGANRVVMPESAQGALGPVLVCVGQAYEDYRNHPLFTDRMSAFLRAFLGRDIRFEYPRLWNTKAETIKAFAETQHGSQWIDTRSCWQQNRQSSVNGRRRQCGICAACLLRRMSIHASGLSENNGTYVWEDLSASRFECGAAPGFNPRNITKKMREYAIAGTLHLDHMAAMSRSQVNAEALAHNAFNLASSLGLTEADAASRLDRVLVQHHQEWSGFMDELGSNSFMALWASGQR